jgi:hypothetical protein
MGISTFTFFYKPSYAEFFYLIFSRKEKIILGINKIFDTFTTGPMLVPERISGDPDGAFPNNVGSNIINVTNDQL